MSRLMITSDLHLGHRNIHKFRTQFSSAEEHHEIVFDNLASNIGKRDTLMILGDSAFTDDWIRQVGSINCLKKVLILGNHDTDRNTDFMLLASLFNEVHSLLSKRNIWFSHCPIHPQEIRRRYANIHGHTHPHLVLDSEREPDPRYINVCLEHTEYKPISFEELKEKHSILQQ